MIQTSSLRDFSPWFADFHFGACRDKFVDIPYVNHFGAIMILRISSKADFTSFSIHDPRCLADSSCMVKVVQQHKYYQQQFQKKKCVSIEN